MLGMRDWDKKRLELKRTSGHNRVNYHRDGKSSIDLSWKVILTSVLKTPHVHLDT